MVVWVLIITMTQAGSGYGSAGPNHNSGAAVAIIDNIETAESCEQLAKTIRLQRGVTQATCAPVRKAVVK